MKTCKNAEYIIGFGIIYLYNFNGFEKISEQDFSSVVHEYIHFLQDTTTTFGYSHTAYMITRLNSLRYNVNNGLFDKIPISIDNISNAYLKKEMIDIILGDTDSWTYNGYDSVEITGVEYRLDDDFENLIYKDMLEGFDFVRVPQLKLELKKNNETEEKIFAFGAMAIMESMANLIELKLFPTKKNIFQIQYDIVEILCKKIIPKTSEKKEFVVAICDASLMFDNPGLVLYVTILQMSKEYYEPLHISEVYDYFFERNLPHYKDTYKTELDTLKEAYGQLFPQDDNELGNINKNYLSILEKKETIFLERHKFIEELMMKTANDSKQYIMSLMKEYHSPVYIVNNVEIYSGKETNDLDANIVLASKTLYSILNYGVQKGCDLVDLCKANESSNYNTMCCTNPLQWCTNILQKDKNICPLGFLLYKWDLNTNLSKFYNCDTQ